ncbi:hypothetical protein B566_EDAN006464 [Ephemera danica]|nr:hypothetical protein B566_EDAN006464 [Ephemera danica]
MCRLAQRRGMVTLQPGAVVSAARDNEADPLLASTPPGNGAPPGGGGGGGVGGNSAASYKARKARLGSLRSRSPRLPPPLSPTRADSPVVTVRPNVKRVSPPALLIRSATSDCMGSPPGVDTVVTISDSEQVHVALASPSLMAQLHPRTPPDLRVDFFSEVKLAASKNKEKEEKKCTRGVCETTAGDDCGGEVFSALEAGSCSSPAAGSKSIYLPVSPPRSPQHSSVVVTPASGSSLELPSSPGVSPAAMKQPMPLLQQLPDVANQLTLQELHDFEMKYGSPHHSRSQSVKTMKRPNFLSLPQQRSRVASMPNTGNEEEYYRLRHFSITGKGIVNRGDSLKSRRSRSNTSVASSNSSHSTEHLGGGGVGACLQAGSYPGSARTSAEASLASSRESSTSGVGNLPYRVIMLGAAGVGKTSVISQFTTSEHLHAYDTSLGE